MREVFELKKMYLFLIHDDRSIRGFVLRERGEENDLYSNYKEIENLVAVLSSVYDLLDILKLLISSS